MSGARLREAARVLRERAEAASVDVLIPGDWYDARTKADAAYIATVSPPFALAVADLLANEANLIRSVEKLPDLHSPLNSARVSLLLAVADAVLGADQ